MSNKRPDNNIPPRPATRLSGVTKKMGNSSSHPSKSSKDPDSTSNSPKGPAPKREAKLDGTAKSVSNPKVSSGGNNRVTRTKPASPIIFDQLDSLLNEDFGSFGNSPSSPSPVANTEKSIHKRDIASTSTVNSQAAPADDSHKHRLLLGEASFIFALALLDKHPELAPYITATTYESEAVMQDTYPEAAANKKELRKRGVTVLHNVDAKKLHENTDLRAKYGHIHFNFPHDGKDYKSSKTHEVVADFFQSARKKLTDNGHIHMALVSGDKTPFYHGVLYKIADATTTHGFDFKKKHIFNQDRYPDYIHKMTTQGNSVDHVEENGREHVFEKIDSDDEDALETNARAHRRLSREGTKKYLPEMETDSESSDYEDYKTSTALATSPEDGLDLDNISFRDETDSEGTESPNDENKESP